MRKFNKKYYKIVDFNDNRRGNGRCTNCDVRGLCGMSGNKFRCECSIDQQYKYDYKQERSDKIKKLMR